MTEPRTNASIRRQLAAKSSNTAFCEECGLLVIDESQGGADLFLWKHQLSEHTEEADT